MKVRILVIRFSSLGDIILLTPLFRELKKVFPDSEIDFLTSTTFAEVVENNPHLSRIYRLDRKKGAAGLREMIEKLAEPGYDFLFDAHRSLRSRLFLTRLISPYYSLKKNIFGVNKRSFKRNLLLSFKFNLLREAPSQRRAYLDMLRSFVDPARLDDGTELFPKVDQEFEAMLQKELGTPKRLIAIGPSASFEGKSWPKQNFAQLSDALMEKGVQVVLVGGPADSEPDWIEANCRIKPANLSGRLSYLEVAELLHRCDLAISNDTAIIHFAEAMKTPAISIFGPTAAEFGYGPFLPQSRLIALDLPCRPCSRNGKGECKTKTDRQCLREIEIPMVLEAAFKILSPLD